MPPPNAQDSLLGSNAPWQAKMRSDSTGKAFHDDKHRKPTSRQYRYDAQDSYLLEIIGLLGAAIFLIGLVVLLSHFDDQQLPRWPHISLNTITSWFSTIIRAFLLLALSRSLGQLKWVWMARQSRLVKDIEDFDSASRGPLGSLQLLCSRKTWHFHSFGCIAMILAVVIGPFIQNTIQTYPKAVVDSNQIASLTNASTYHALGTLITSDLFTVDQILKANVYAGLLDNSTNQPWATPIFTCTTGNCTYPPVATLTIKSTCVNLTDQLQTTCNTAQYHENCTIALDSGTSLWVAAGDSGLPFVINSTKDGVFANQSFLDPVQYIMVEDIEPALQYEYQLLLANVSFVATECRLNPCVDVIQSTVSGTVYSERILASWCSRGYSYQNGTTVPQHDESEDWSKLTASLGYSGNSTAIEYVTGFSLPPGFMYDGRGDNDVIGSLAWFIYSIFSGYYKIFRQSASWSTSYKSNNAATYASADIIQSIFRGALSQCAAGQDHLECAMTNTAKAMTKSIRDAAYLADTSSNRGNTTVGQTWVQVTYIKIVWFWLLLPIAVWCLASISLVITVLQTQRAAVPIWSNSVLPLLFVAHETVFETEEGDVSNAMLSKVSKQTRARLVVKDKKIHWE